MKTKIAIVIFITTSIFLKVNPVFAQGKPDEKLGWQLGVQASSWFELSLDQVVDRADSCSIKYIEGVRGKLIGGGINGKLDINMPDSTSKAVLKMLNKKGIRMLSIGVVNAESDAEWRHLFELAKQLGLHQFAIEPAIGQIPMVAKLAQEFQIRVAIHNHPYPSLYWNPDTLIKYVAPYKKYIGACADLGHWVRAGIDPVDGLRKYYRAGISVMEIHFKDLNEKPSAAYTAFMRSLPFGEWKPAKMPKGPDGPHDVPWGTGISHIDDVIKELKRQHFKGLILAEYEWERGKNATLIMQSIQNLRDKLAGRRYTALY